MDILGKKKFKPNDDVFAQQLTMYEWKLFIKLQPREFFHLSWTKPNRNESARNVCRMIHWTNLIGNWVSCYILEGKQSQKRADRIASFVTLMEVCYSFFVILFSNDLFSHFLAFVMFNINSFVTNFSFFSFLSFFSSLFPSLFIYLIFGLFS